MSNVSANTSVAILRTNIHPKDGNCNVGQLPIFDARLIPETAVLHLKTAAKT
jgi:hypothetical protein